MTGPTNDPHGLPPFDEYRDAHRQTFAELAHTDGTVEHDALTRLELLPEESLVQTVDGAAWWSETVEGDPSAGTYTATAWHHGGDMLTSEALLELGVAAVLRIGPAAGAR